MPIGDLLAQISGDKSQSPSPAPSRPPVAATAKRKADDDLRGNVSNKTPRTSTTGLGSSSAPKPATAPKPAPRTADKSTTVTGYRGSAARPSDRSTSAPRPVGNGNTAAKPSSAGARSLNGSGGSRVSSALPNRSSPSVSAAPAKEGPPKKGSFAEILARAQKAQASMGQVGKIQHKPVDKIPTKKEREEMKKDLKKDAKAPAGKSAAARHPTKFQGTARPSAAPQRSSIGTNGASRNGVADKARDPKAAAKARAAAEEQEKKLKKAAVATTGYTGTARPRPGASTTKKKPAPGGALLNSRPAPRYGGSAKRSRYEEEEDEDLDDFIEYDDEEEQRYEYNSDGSSDMEAGMDDVWEEERMAERVARKEDLAEEMLEKKLKAEKEARKRAYFEEQQRRGRR